MASNFPNNDPGLPPTGGYGLPPTSPPPGGPIIPASLIERVKNIIMTPKTEWPRIDAEPMTQQGIYTRHVLLLAAIGPIAFLIGSEVFGYSLFGVTYRPPIGVAIETAALNYLKAVGGVFLMALAVDALAPNFGGQKNIVQATKAIAFAFTVSWVAGAIGILPSLTLIGLVGLLAGLYALYTLYLGLPRLMRVPADKAATYTIVSVVVSALIFIVIGMIANAVISMVTPAVVGNPLTGRDFTGTVAVPGVGSVDMGKLDEAAARMEAAANSAQHGANGAAGVTPVGADVLQGLLPASVGGFTRTSVESSSGSAAGIGGSEAKGSYTSGDQHFELTIADAGAIGALASLGGAFNVQSNKQTATGYEKTTTQNGAMISEKWDNSGHSGSYSTMVASRFMVEAEGSAPSIDPLRAAVAAVDQGKLGALAH